MCVCATFALTTTAQEKVGEKILIYCRARTMRQQHKNLLIRLRLFIDCSSMSNTTRNYLAAKSPASHCVWEKAQRGSHYRSMKISLSPRLKLFRVSFKPFLVATHHPHVSISTNCLGVSYTTGRQIRAARHIHWHYSLSMKNWWKFHSSVLQYKLKSRAQKTNTVFSSKNRHNWRVFFHFRH